MNPLALAVIGQLRAISEAVSKEYWRSEELLAMSDLLHEAAGNAEQLLARRRTMRKYGYPDQGGAA